MMIVAVAIAGRSSDSGLKQDNRDESQGGLSLWIIVDVAFWRDLLCFREGFNGRSKRCCDRLACVRSYHVARNAGYRVQVKSPELFAHISLVIRRSIRGNLGVPGPGIGSCSRPEIVV
jgi:hypothetical protein